jgi:AcrR family transcriptional regulator
MSGKPRKKPVRARPAGRTVTPRAHLSKRAGKPRVRRDPTQARARFTVDVIVEAAGRLLVENGRRGVTTNAVAERAGVSIGSVYQYFPNKDAIFQALQARHRGQVMPLIQHTLARIADPTVDIVDAILGLMRAMAELHADAPARLRAISEELHERTSPVEIQEFADATTKVLATRFRCSEDHVRPTAWLACASLAHVGRALVHHPPPLDGEKLLEAVGRMVRGLLTDIV